MQAYPKKQICGYLFLSSETSLLAPLKLLSTGVTRYPLTILTYSECSDFPPLLAQERPSDMETNYTINFQKTKTLME